MRFKNVQISKHKTTRGQSAPRITHMSHGDTSRVWVGILDRFRWASSSILGKIQIKTPNSRTKMRWKKTYRTYIKGLKGLYKNIPTPWSIRSIWDKRSCIKLNRHNRHKSYWDRHIATQAFSNSDILGTSWYKTRLR